MKGTLWTLRILAIFLVIFLATKPSVQRPDPNRPNQWAVFLDVSRSMKTLDPEERLDVAKDVLKKFSSKINFDFFKFGQDLTRIQFDDLFSLEASDNKTDLAGALRKAFDEKKYRGAIVISDGRQVGSGDPVTESATLGVPVITMGVGDSSQFRDVAIREIQSPPFAFKNLSTSLSANISIVGYPGQKITVKLRQGRKVLGIQVVEVKTSEAETSVSFSWVPESLGSKILTVQANTYEGEITTKNNKKSITLDVGRDRFRVLYICGRPGPEYGFLRHQFKSDPAVELVTFVILRSGSNIVPVADSELSLIPFPTQDVLIKQMATFDLVVFEEFSYQKYGLLPAILHAIRKKVLDGGSFLLMGGMEAFGPGSHYAFGEIGEMIPVQFGDGRVKPLTGEFKFIPKTIRHPVLRLEPQVGSNKKLWDSLPPLDGAVLLPGVKPGATIIGSLRKDDKEFPVLTGWTYGKGRVAALATRTTWNWSMVGENNSRGTWAYQQFWKNMVLWLTHAEQFQRVRIALEDKLPRIGVSNELRVWTYDEYFKPISDVDVKIQLTTPNQTRESLTPAQQTTGVFSIPFTPKETGTYVAQVWVTRTGQKIGKDKISFNVLESNFEEEDLRPDFSILKEIAHVSGGKFIRPDEFSWAAFQDFDQTMKAEGGRRVLIWTSPWVLVCLLILFVAEWFIRKRRGLP